MFLVEGPRRPSPRRTRSSRTPRVVSQPYLPERVYIVGFMGAGKTTIGRLLSERLGWRYVDLDARVEESAGMKISDIFAMHGEGRFRSLEYEALREISAESGRAIVSLGGGAFVSEVNRALVRRSGVSVWLDVPFRVLFKRVAGDRRRPLAQTPEQMYQLYRSRLPFYHEADIRLRAGDVSAPRAARALTRLLREDWSIVAERRKLFP